MSRLLIRAGSLLTLDEQFHIYRPGTLLIQDGRILAAQPGDDFDAPAAEIMDWTDRLVMPGLVNAHTHSPMVLFRGLAEGYSLLTLDGWYNAIRSGEHFLTADMIAPAVAVSCAEMIRTGTTCFADHYFFMNQIVPVVEQSGMRAAAGVRNRRARVMLMPGHARWTRQPHF